MKLLYFAYGSNLNRKQMRARCPNHVFYDLGVIRDYELVFTGYSKTRDGGVADIRPKQGCFVEGVLYEINLKDLEALDKAEGYPNSYNRSALRVEATEHEVSAIVYHKDLSQELSDPHPDYAQIIALAYDVYDFDKRNLLNALK